jgi:predicted nucleic acid-binding protein
MLLLDTNVLSEPLRRTPNRKVHARLGVHAGNLAACIITLEELRYGATLLPNANEFWERVEEEVIPLATWIPVDKEIAVAAADLRAGLYKKGQTVGTSDCLIAATALVHDCVLVTRNTNHFKRMPGLHLENWFV